MDKTCEEEEGEEIEDVFSKEQCSEHVQEGIQFELAIVCNIPKSTEINPPNIGGEEVAMEGFVDVVEYLMKALESSGLIVQRIDGLNSAIFLKIAGTQKALGQAAEQLQLKKLTNLGLETLFEWELRDSFVRQAHDQALFSWTERYNCLEFLIHDLKHDHPQGVHFKMTTLLGDFLPSMAPVIATLEEAGVITDIFPIHDEELRKKLLENWSLNWLGGTVQPLDAIYSYFGPKIALYFAFLGMYTNWLVFPAVIGTVLYVVDFGDWRGAVPPLSAVIMVVWGSLFLQFWKRRNFSLLERWEVRLEEDEIHARKSWDATEEESLLEQHGKSRGLSKGGIPIGASVKQALREEEWRDRVLVLRNIVVVFISVVFFQIPFELLYTAFNHHIASGLLKFASIGGYIFFIQKFKVVGGKLAVWLNNSQAHISSEAAADSLIYKVMNNVMESLVPYALYLYAKRKTLKSEREGKKALGEKVTGLHTSHIENEYLKPRYVTEIAKNQYDGLFDDYLELALQFGIVVMFGSFWPLVAVFSLLNNLVEIRSDSFKLLEMLRRPVPHLVGSIGAWINIFQYLGGAAIVSNCFLLIFMYDKGGKWSMDPGLAAVLILEHCLMAVRFSLSWFVPEVPAWVKAKRQRRRRLQEDCSLRVLRSFGAKSSPC